MRFESGPRRWFRSKTGGARWRWRWRLWRPFAITGRKWIWRGSRRLSTKSAADKPPSALLRAGSGGDPHKPRACQTFLLSQQFLVFPVFTYVYMLRAGVIWGERNGVKDAKIEGS